MRRSSAPRRLSMRPCRKRPELFLLLHSIKEHSFVPQMGFIPPAAPATQGRLRPACYSPPGGPDPGSFHAASYRSCGQDCALGTVIPAGRRLAAASHLATVIGLMPVSLARLALRTTASAKEMPPSPRSPPHWCARRPALVSGTFILHEDARAFCLRHQY